MWKGRTELLERDVLASGQLHEILDPVDNFKLAGRRKSTDISGCKVQRRSGVSRHFVYGRGARGELTHEPSVFKDLGRHLGLLVVG